MNEIEYIKQNSILLSEEAYLRKEDYIESLEKLNRQLKEENKKLKKDKWLKPKTFMEKYDYSRSTLYDKIKNNKLTYKVIGGRYRILG